MPIDKYLILRKAVEIEEIAYRMQIISDINTAFFGNKERIEELQQQYTKLMGFEITWKADPDWEEKIKKYAAMQK